VHGGKVEKKVSQGNKEMKIIIERREEKEEIRGSGRKEQAVWTEIWENGERKMVVENTFWRMYGWIFPLGGKNDEYVLEAHPWMRIADVPINYVILVVC
jgi:hypothetical protein